MTIDVTKTCRDLSELTEQAQKACDLFLEKCKEAGLNVLITETYRSQERQDYLYQQGRTIPGNIVTWTKSSRHTSRRAWDICKNLKGKEYTDENFFKECGKIAKDLGVIWGGTWDTPDTPHFEIGANWEEPIQEEKEVVSKQTIVLNGVEKIVDVISKDGNNYIKLQDLRDSKISIGYANKKPIINVISKK